MTNPETNVAPKVHYTGKALLNMPPQQVYAVFKLRVDVFVNEQRAPFAEIDEIDAHPGTHHIMGYVHPGSDPTSPWGAPDAGSPLRLAGTCRVFGPAEAQHIGRICVAEDLRGHGIAKQLVLEALEVCEARAAALDPTTQKAIVKLDAQTYLTKFYESFGFEVVGDPFDMDGVEHVEMHKTLS